LVTVAQQLDNFWLNTLLTLVRYQADIYRSLRHGCWPNDTPAAHSTSAENFSAERKDKKRSTSLVQPKTRKLPNNMNECQVLWDVMSCRLVKLEEILG